MGAMKEQLIRMLDLAEEIGEEGIDLDDAQLWERIRREYPTVAGEDGPGEWFSQELRKAFLVGKVRADLAGKLTEPTPVGGARVVTIEGPDGVRHEIPISGDQTVTISVDGKPAAGVDTNGVGIWPDGETWWRLSDLNPRIVDPAEDQSTNRSGLVAVTLLGVDVYVQRTDTRTVVFHGKDDVPDEFLPVVVQVDPAEHIEVENLY